MMDLEAAIEDEEKIHLLLNWIWSLI